MRKRVQLEDYSSRQLTHFSLHPPTFPFLPIIDPFIMEDWLADSNEALELRLGEHRPFTIYCRIVSLILLVRSPIDADILEGDELVTQEPFSPAFTYPIFGEKETIFGYRGLDIKVDPDTTSRLSTNR